MRALRAQLATLVEALGIGFVGGLALLAGVVWLLLPAWVAVVTFVLLLPAFVIGGAWLAVRAMPWTSARREPAPLVPTQRALVERADGEAPMQLQPAAAAVSSGLSLRLGGQAKRSSTVPVEFYCSVCNERFPAEWYREEFRRQEPCPACGAEGQVLVVAAKGSRLGEVHGMPSEERSEWIEVESGSAAIWTGWREGIPEVGMEHGPVFHGADEPGPGKEPLPRGVVSALHGTDLFRDLSIEQLGEVAALAKERSFAPGQELARGGATRAPRSTPSWRDTSS